MNKNKEYFKTNSYHLAIFLLSKGTELSSIDWKSSSERAYFCFVDSNELSKLVKAFDFAPDNSAEVMVDCRKMLSATQNLKRILHERKSSKAR